MDNRFFIRPCRLLRPVTLESCSPPTQAPAPISLSPPRRSERLQLRASAPPVHTSASLSSTFATYPSPQVCSDMPNLLSLRSEKSNSSRSGRRHLPQLPSPLHQLSSRMRPISPSPTRSQKNESSDVHLDQSNNGFSLINLHWASFSTGLPSVLASLQCSSLSFGCSYLSGRRQRQSHARHTELLQTIVHGANKAVSTTAHTQSGAYPGPASPILRLPALPAPADDRVLFERSLIPARGAAVHPVVRFTPGTASASSCSFPGCATSYVCRPTAKSIAHDARLQLTYDDPCFTDVLPSAPPALEYQPEVSRVTGIHAITR